jgi:hypothetical protein
MLPGQLFQIAGISEALECKKPTCGADRALACLLWPGVAF